MHVEEPHRRRAPARPASRSRRPCSRPRRSRGRCRAASRRRAVEPPHQVAHRQRVVADARAARVDRAQVLEADRSAERLGHEREPAQRRSSSAVSAPRRGEVERVIDDVAGADLCAYSSSPSNARLWSALPSCRFVGPCTTTSQLVTSSARRSAVAWRDPVARVREHLDRRRGDLDPAEAGRLDRLERGRTGHHSYGTLRPRRCSRAATELRLRIGSPEARVCRFGMQ